MAKENAKVRRMLTAMREAARIASVMVDGDEAGRIATDRAVHYFVNPDPQYRFMSGDYWDVDEAASLRMRKTLRRIARLLDFPCSTALWIPPRGADDQMMLLVRNGAVQRYSSFGVSRTKREGDIADCMNTGRVVTAALDHPSETLTVLAPVFDSLGGVVGVVELTTLNPATKSLAPAWS